MVGSSTSAPTAPSSPRSTRRSTAASISSGRGGPRAKPPTPSDVGRPTQGQTREARSGLRSRVSRSFVVASALGTALACGGGAEPRSSTIDSGSDPGLPENDGGTDGAGDGSVLPVPAEPTAQHSVATEAFGATRLQ